MTSSIAIQNLRPSEVGFIAAMQHLGFGLFEHLQICGGELVLTPPPITVRYVKFGAVATTGKPLDSALELRQQLAEFFSYVREVDSGEIRTLEIQHGLPFSMEVELAGARTEGGARG
jgi:hypothetical protein